MREPSRLVDLYRVWKLQVDGRRVPLSIQPADGEPYCGWFKMRMVKGGPWVPVAIRCQRELDECGLLTADERLVAVVGDDEPIPAERIMSRYPRPITKAAFDALHEARRADPVMQAVRAPVDLSQRPQEVT